MKEKLLKRWQELQPQLRQLVRYIDDGEDVLQEAFEYLWKKVGEDWRPKAGRTVEEGLTGACYTAVMFARFNYWQRLKSQRRHFVPLDDCDVEHVPDNDPFRQMEQISQDVEEEERRQEMLGLIGLALADQEERFQRVYQLVYFEGRTWKEVAKELGVPVSYVQSLLKTGKSRLQVWLNAHTPDLPCSGSK